MRLQIPRKPASRWSEKTLFQIENQNTKEINRQCTPEFAPKLSKDGLPNSGSINEFKKVSIYYLTSKDPIR
jgi:hypothetical protein